MVFYVSGFFLSLYIGLSVHQSNLFLRRISVFIKATNVNTD